MKFSSVFKDKGSKYMNYAWRNPCNIILGSFNEDTVKQIGSLKIAYFDILTLPANIVM